MTNKDTLWLTENPETGQLVFQFIHRQGRKYRDGWSRYLLDFYTEGWEWEGDTHFESVPIGQRCILQWQ